ncbi:MAG: hypothetical protein PHE58_05265 [Candidatus Omnitrophica bacterium]|nr:hypothetical protein [Candidatus Omnitrophota bacterium]
MLTKYLARLVIVFIFLGFFTPAFSSEVLHDIFTELDFSFEGIEDFSVQKNIVREADKSVSRTIIARKDETTVKIEITEGLSAQDADRYISERMYVIESLFKRLPNPYPGMITNTIECPESFKPEKTEIKINGQAVSVYVLNSTPRFTYGVCVDELIKYRGVAASLYVPGKKALFRVELFFPKEQFDKEKALTILGSFVPGKKT